MGAAWLMRLRKGHVGLNDLGAVRLLLKEDFGSQIWTMDEDDGGWRDLAVDKQQGSSGRCDYHFVPRTGKVKGSWVRTAAGGLAMDFLFSWL